MTCNGVYIEVSGYHNGQNSQKGVCSHFFLGENTIDPN